MIHSADGRFHNGFAFAKLLVYPVVELNGIVYADSYHDRKSGK
ncbi:Uncharacterised protein [uncultured archaeon]|nr:Uncharacterised protein [uncultured archaeon]